MVHWHIDQNTWAPFNNMLHGVQFDPASLPGWLNPQNPQQLAEAQTRGAETTLVQPLIKRYFQTFVHEAILVSRLDGSLFLDLSRFMLYMFYCRFYVNGNFWTPNMSMLWPDAGNACHTFNNFLPDRSARTTSNSPSGQERTRVTGDVKLSSKFHSSWMPQPGQPDASATTREFRQVLSQLNFYMTSEIGQHGNRHIRYAYIVTDEEVILLKRDGQSLHVSSGFPLRGVPHPNGQPWTARQNVAISGMFALVLIHLLGSLDHTVPGPGGAPGYLV